MGAARSLSRQANFCLQTSVIHGAAVCSKLQRNLRRQAAASTNARSSAACSTAGWRAVCWYALHVAQLCMHVRTTTTKCLTRGIILR